MEAVFKENDLFNLRNRHRLKFITLTVQNFPTDLLLWGLSAYFRWFKRLKQRKLFKDKVRGFFYAFEITKGQDGNWHLHLHIIADAQYMDVETLSKQWGKIVSKEWRGFIVHIEEIKNIKKSFKEISKYPFDPSSLTIAERCFLDSYFHKRRLIGFGGEWYNLFKGVPYDTLIDSSPLIEDIKKKGMFLYTMKVDELNDNWFWSTTEGLWILPKIGSEKRE